MDPARNKLFDYIKYQTLLFCLVVHQAIKSTTSRMFVMLQVHSFIFGSRPWFTKYFTGEQCQSYLGPDLQGHSHSLNREKYFEAGLS